MLERRTGYARPGPSAPLEFRRDRLPAGTLVYSDFGAAQLRDELGRVLTRPNALVFRGTQRGVGIDWANSPANSYLRYATLTPPAVFTMEVVFKFGTVAQQNVATWCENGSTDTWDRQIRQTATGKVEWYVFAGSGTATGTTTFAQGDIVHALCTYDGTTYRLYVNGIQEATLTAGSGYGGYGTPTLQLGLGGLFAAAANNTTLSFLVANRAFSASEALMRAKLPFSALIAPRMVGVGSGASPNVTVAITGNAATTAIGTVVPSNSLLVTGIAGTGAVGTVAPGMAVPLTGAAATGATGDVDTGANLGLSGVSAVGSVGSVGASFDAEVAISGVEATAAVGSVGTTGGTAATSAGGTARRKPSRMRRINVYEEDQPPRSDQLKRVKTKPAQPAWYDDEDDVWLIL